MNPAAEYHIRNEEGNCAAGAAGRCSTGLYPRGSTQVPGNFAQGFERRCVSAFVTREAPREVQDGSAHVGPIHRSRDGRAAEKTCRDSQGKGGLTNVDSSVNSTARV